MTVYVRPKRASRAAAGVSTKGSEYAVSLYIGNATAHIEEAGQGSFQLPARVADYRLGFDRGAITTAFGVTDPWRWAPEVYPPRGVWNLICAGDAVSAVLEEKESNAQGVLAAYVEWFFLLSPGARMRCTLAGLECEGHVYRFPRGLNMTVYREGDELVCAQRGLRLFGMGATFGDAFSGFCEYFDVLYQEYVETDDPLDPSGERLARGLRRLVGD